jgi:ceramide glucosyltransferase
LSDLLPEARFPILVINDSDIRVPSDYLRHVVAGLADSETGLVTCLYRPAADTLPARWESLGITTDFAPSVLAALLLGLNEFALGSTLAFRAADLSRIGGFEAFSDYIADDYQLGKRIASSGKRIRLSYAVVETYIAGRTWRDVWNHQVRWAATVRVSQGAGYAGLPVANAAFWSIVALAGGLPFLALFLLLLRYATGFLGAAVLRDRAPLRLWYLLPFRDLWGLVVWAAGWSRRDVIWRDRRLRLDSRGRILSVK